MPALFEAHLVTDAKRLVRGEHYRLAASLLKARSVDRRTNFRVMMIPGRSANEEMSAIRAVMPRAYVVAADRDQIALELAHGAGANECIKMDLKEADKFESLEPFDLINVDLCGPANSELKAIFACARKRVNSGGVLMGWFSYGRDVLEAYVAIARNGDLMGKQTISQTSEAIHGRVAFLSGPTFTARSVLRYRGNKMPMCSVVWQKIRSGCALCGDNALSHGGNRKSHEFTFPYVESPFVTDEDLRLIIHSAPEEIILADLYATPASRIAAWRAVATREGVLKRADGDQ